jgi:hypothetical protein
MEKPKPGEGLAKLINKSLEDHSVLFSIIRARGVALVVGVVEAMSLTEIGKSGSDVVLGQEGNPVRGSRLARLVDGELDRGVRGPRWRPVWGRVRAQCLANASRTGNQPPDLHPLIGKSD